MTDKEQIKKELKEIYGFDDKQFIEVTKPINTAINIDLIIDRAIDKTLEKAEKEKQEQIEEFEEKIDNLFRKEEIPYIEINAYERQQIKDKILEYFNKSFKTTHNPSYANSSKNDYRRDKINQEIMGIQMGCGKKFDTDLKICGEEMEEGTGIVWLCPDCWEKENKSQGDKNDR